MVMVMRGFWANPFARPVAAGLLAVVALLAAGCSSPPPDFKLNLVYLKAEERNGTLTETQVQELADALEGLFGTPDNPQVPQLEGVDAVAIMNPDYLRKAAGAVGSDELGRAHGLYRKHCVHCHGVTGDGAGPTAEFLNPYPRDYRRGTFKFKSTPGENPPTHADLKRVLIEGINGTSMPSFRLLDDDELEALVHYVRYLAIRGRVERALIRSSVSELEPDMHLLDFALAQTDPAEFKSQLDFILGEVESELKRWENPDTLVQPVPNAPAGWHAEGQEAQRAEAAGQWSVLTTDGRVLVGSKVTEADGELVVETAGGQTQRVAVADVEERKPLDELMEQYIARGKELFSGNVANCAQCHGTLALGDGQVTDYDEWTAEWTTKNNPPINPKTDINRVDAFRALGALPPRNIRPRNLRMGIYRGGRRPVDIYLRIKNGIAGTPMPAASSKLTDLDVWALVAYVRSLPYEPISQPPRDAAFQRDRL